jgi:hypothetical protein
MRIFHCDHCDHLVFFENVQCVRCGNALAYLPDLGFVGSVSMGDDKRWRSPLSCARSRSYRLCDNYAKESVCNWAVAEDAHSLCISCRLTRVRPDLSRSEDRARWYRLEVAKRRLVYTLGILGLPLANRRDDPERGLAFEFRGDGDEAAPPVYTGHASGIITINVAEADDVEREKRRLQLHEPYRTLLGHFRHESGHYYWDRLIMNSAWLEPFREKFGDERQDYAKAIAQHYAAGAPADWQQRFVSAYASVHPWEDWAETWAHFLHMVDALETAAACGLSLRPRRPDEPHMEIKSTSSLDRFDTMIDDWFSLTYVLNNLNRGLGLPDGYPFVLSTPAIDKLRLVHDVVAAMPNVGPPAEPSVR